LACFVAASCRLRSSDSRWLGVELVEIVGELDGAGGVLGHEQLDAVGRGGHPAGGVEPGPELEGHVLAVDSRGVGQAGELDQPREAGAAPRADVLQAMLHEQAVLVDERHHVGDRAEGGEADRPQERLAEPGRDAACSAGPRGDRPGELEGHAGAAEVAEGIRGAGEPRVDEHVGRGKLLGEVVVVGDDQLEAEPASPFRLRGRGDAAVDRDHEVRAVGGELLEGLGVEAVALVLAAGHVPGGLGVEGLEAADEDRRRAHAVGVVVAVDHDLPAGLHRGQDAVGRLGHAGKRLGITEVREGAREKRLHRTRIRDTAGGEQRRDEARHAGRPLQCRHGGSVVGTDVPALGHRGNPFHEPRKRPVYGAGEGLKKRYSTAPCVEIPR